jgi:group I intron endonuclease
MIGIYKITSFFGRIYIGQSKNIDQRFEYYKRLKCRPQIRLYNSLLKHGVDNHIFETIEECSIDLLNDRERYWQEFYNVLGKKGLNCNLVSTQNYPKVLSEETKLRISNSLTGSKHTEESKRKIIKGLIGHLVSEETRRKISESNKNKKRSTETREKISNALTGRKIPKDVIDKITKTMSSMNHYNSRIIINTQNGIFYESITEAAKYNNIHRNTLCNYLTGFRKNKTYLVYA